MSVAIATVMVAAMALAASCGELGNDLVVAVNDLVNDDVACELF